MRQDAAIIVHLILRGFKRVPRIDAVSLPAASAGSTRIYRRGDRKGGEAALQTRYEGERCSMPSHAPNVVCRRERENCHGVSLTRLPTKSKYVCIAE